MNCICQIHSLRLNVIMSILSFLRRSFSHYADDRAVENFERVNRGKGLLPKITAFDAAIENDAKDRAKYLDEIENLIGVKPSDIWK